MILLFPFPSTGPHTATAESVSNEGSSLAVTYRIFCLLFYSVIRSFAAMTNLDSDKNGQRQF